MEAPETKRLTADEIQRRYYERFTRDARISPCHTNRASELGHPCSRYLVLCRTQWQQRAIPPLKAQLIFNEGHHQERALMMDLQAAGFEIRQAQRDLHWPEFQITGHLDWILALPGYEGEFLTEAKSMNPHIWEGVNTIADMIGSKHSWVRKYPAQLQIYLLLHARDGLGGAFILKNKSSGEIKIIESPLDYEYAESLLKKAQAVNEHVKAGTLPDYLPVDQADDCDMCPFYGRACEPARAWGEGAQLLDDTELPEMLDRREELRPARDEYERIDKQVKAAIEKTGATTAICGMWLVQRKEITRSEKAKEARTFTYWTTTFKKMAANQ